MYDIGERESSGGRANYYSDMTQKTVDQAIQALKRGGIVIYPTDTAFGIGCRIDNYRAVDRLLRIKKRIVGNPMPILVSGVSMALAYLSHPSIIVRRLMSTYWPGALTIVAPCIKEIVYSPIRGDGDTVGLRMPNHKIALAIITAIGVPIIGSSANFSKQLTPFTQEDLDPELVNLVDVVVPGRCSVRRISTVVDCSRQPYQILRQGAVRLPK